MIILPKVRLPFKMSFFSLISFGLQIVVVVVVVSFFWGVPL